MEMRTCSTLLLALNLLIPQSRADCNPRQPFSIKRIVRSAHRSGHPLVHRLAGRLRELNHLPVGDVISWIPDSQYDRLPESLPALQMEELTG